MATTDVLFRYVVNDPHHILSGFDPFEMVGVVVNLDAFVPATRNE